MKMYYLTQTQSHLIYYIITSVIYRVKLINVITLIIIWNIHVTIFYNKKTVVLKITFYQNRLIVCCPDTIATAYV